MSQRALKRQIRDAKADLAFVQRLAESAYAIVVDAAKYPTLGVNLNAYCEDLERRIEEHHGFVLSLVQQLRRAQDRRAASRTVPA